MNALYMETTTKSPEQTSAEIESILMKYGLTKFMKNYKDGSVIGCVFGIKIDGKEVPISLPVNWEPLFEMSRQGKTKYIRTKEQAQRVAWRQVLRWIEAQLAIVNIGMVELGEVFLPYVLVQENRTVYQEIKSRNFTLLEGKS